MSARCVPSGVWEGHLIRRARKAGRCDYFRGVRADRPESENGRCPNIIQPGDLYVEGELRDDGAAGGFARERYCLACVPSAKAAIEQSEVA